MKSIVTVLGARPQFIKASVVSHAIAGSGELTELVVHTGQHFDDNMSGCFFSELGMRKPDYFLDINGSSHGAMTGRMIEAVERVLLREKPDAVLVYGDTNSTLAGALAAVKLQIPVAHVEAGLRSFNMAMPEEVNRILTDRISRWLFTPTTAAGEHLQREGFAPEMIIPVGDVMYDVAMHHGSRVEAEDGLLSMLNVAAKRYVLATIHRAENTDDPHRLRSIVAALRVIAATTPVIWPLHPRTRQALKERGLLEDVERSLQVVDPVGYVDMVRLEKYAAIIVTDSGGVQKEAFFYQVPCVTVRDETEWMELVDAGWNRLAPPGDAATIIENIQSALGTRGDPIEPYGSGDAAKKIVVRLIQDLCA